jgi:hypothetical protein
MLGNGGTLLAATDYRANYVIFHAALFLSMTFVCRCSLQYYFPAMWTDVCFSHFSRLIRLGNRSAEMNGILFFKGSVQPDLNGLKKCYF